MVERIDFNLGQLLSPSKILRKFEKTNASTHHSLFMSLNLPFENILKSSRMVHSLAGFFSNQVQLLVHVTLTLFAASFFRGQESIFIVVIFRQCDATVARWVDNPEVVGSRPARDTLDCFEQAV